MPSQRTEADHRGKSAATVVLPAWGQPADPGSRTGRPPGQGAGARKKQAGAERRGCERPGAGGPGGDRDRRARPGRGRPGGPPHDSGGPGFQAGPPFPHPVCVSLVTFEPSTSMTKMSSRMASLRSRLLASMIRPSCVQLEPAACSPMPVSFLGFEPLNSMTQISQAPVFSTVTVIMRPSGDQAGLYNDPISVGVSRAGVPEPSALIT